MYHFNGKKYLEFMRENRDIPHISKYHLEDYLSHVFGAVAEVARKTSYITYDAAHRTVYRPDNRVLVLAAALHDIAKPRTVVVREGKGATFYGHEDVSMEELSQFLDNSDPDFQEVFDIVRAHALPYEIHGPKPFSDIASKKLDTFVKNHSSAVSAALFALNDADARAKRTISRAMLLAVTVMILEMATDAPGHSYKDSATWDYASDFWNGIV